MVADNISVVIDKYAIPNPKAVVHAIFEAVNEEVREENYRKEEVISLSESL